MKLSDKELEVISKAAATAALEHLEKEKKKQEKKKYDSRLRNIKLLLRNYRTLKKHCIDIELEIDRIDENIEIELLESKEFKLKSIRKSKEKTLAMVRFVDKMIAVYKAMCKQSGAEEDRRYEVIYHMYIAKEKKTSIEISEMHNIAVRTVFLDIEKASKDLSVLVFGLDGIRFKS